MSSADIQVDQWADMSPPVTEPSAVAPDAGVNQSDNSKATRLC
jgi:hypothetical protein